MHPVARVSTNICRNLRTQQMSVLVLLCTSYITRFGPYWWPSLVPALKKRAYKHDEAR
jgi:hypothetical protein